MLQLELGLLKAYRKRKDYRKTIEDSEKLDDDVIKQHRFFKDHIFTLLQQQIYFFESSIHKLKKMSDRLSSEQTSGIRLTLRRIVQMQNYVKKLKDVQKSKNLSDVWEQIKNRFKNHKKSDVKTLINKYEKDVRKTEHELVICDIRIHLNHEYPIQLAKDAYKQLSTRLNLVWRHFHYDGTVHVYPEYIRKANDKVNFRCPGQQG
jgi:hypothetical protein